MMPKIQWTNLPPALRAHLFSSASPPKQLRQVLPQRRQVHVRLGQQRLGLEDHVEQPVEVVDVEPGALLLGA